MSISETDEVTAGVGNGRDRPAVADEDTLAACIQCGVECDHAVVVECRPATCARGVRVEAVEGAGGVGNADKDVVDGLRFADGTRHDSQEKSPYPCPLASPTHASPPVRRAKSKKGQRHHRRRPRAARSASPGRCSRFASIKCAVVIRIEHRVGGDVAGIQLPVSVAVRRRVHGPARIDDQRGGMADYIAAAVGYLAVIGPDVSGAGGVDRKHRGGRARDGPAIRQRSAISTPAVGDRTKAAGDDGEGRGLSRSHRLSGGMLGNVR